MKDTSTTGQPIDKRITDVDKNRAIGIFIIKVTFMAYLDNQSITVQAVLTKKGRELLALNGGLNITAFALADDEIDYKLYQPNHPHGSAYYDLAIRNTPVFEAFSDGTQTLKYKLVTLDAGTTTIPVISLGQSSINVGSTYAGDISIPPVTNPTYNTTLGYTAILSDRSAGTITVSNAVANSSATIPSFIGDVSTTTAQVVVGLSFKFTPNSSLTQTVATNLTIVGNESGGSITIPVTVNVS